MQITLVIGDLAGAIGKVFKLGAPPMAVGILAGRGERVPVDRHALAGLLVGTLRNALGQAGSRQKQSHYEKNRNIRWPHGYISPVLLRFALKIRGCGGRGKRRPASQDES